MSGNGTWHPDVLEDGSGVLVSCFGKNGRDADLWIREDGIEIVCGDKSGVYDEIAVTEPAQLAWLAAWLNEETSEVEL